MCQRISRMAMILLAKERACLQVGRCYEEGISAPSLHRKRSISLIAPDSWRLISAENYVKARCPGCTCWLIRRAWRRSRHRWEGKARGPCPQSWKVGERLHRSFVTRISIDGLLEQVRGLAIKFCLRAYNPSRSTSPRLQCRGVLRQKDRLEEFARASVITFSI